MPHYEEPSWHDRADARIAKQQRKANNINGWAERHEKWQAELAAQREFNQESRARRRGISKAMSEVERATPKIKVPARLAKAKPNFDLMSIAELEMWQKELLRLEALDWMVNARPEQLYPEGARIWLLMAGRGFGKTRAAAEKVRQVCEKPGMSVAVVAKDHRALRDVCFEGRSGLMNVFPPDMIKKYHKGLGDVSLELTNGCMIRGYTAMEPDAVRGQAFDMIWGDEFAAWPKNRAEDMLKQLQLCLRESKVGAICILSTTPKRIPHVVKMVKLAEDPEERIVITKGRSRDNTVLTEEWHRQMEREMGGTRLGRQELEGELVMDVDLALWTGQMIDECRWAGIVVNDKEGDVDWELPRMIGVMTGVDPSGSKDGDATGIVTCGWDAKKRIYVLDNQTTGGDPGIRYGAVCRSAYKYGSGEIWYESAYGGDNAAFGIQQAWKNLQREGEIPVDRACPPLKPSTITGDKAARAMPVVHLYEIQVARPDIRRIYHVVPTETNGIAKLEDEQLTWSTNEKKSPNAIDAAVHCIRQIMRKTGQETTITSAAKSQRRRGNGGFNPFAR